MYHVQQEFINNYDVNTIQKIFPDLDLIPLHIYSNKDIYEFEEEQIG